MSVDRLAARSGGVIGTIGPIRGSGVFSLQERHALTADNYEDVSLYLKMNGANGSTTFYDSSLYGHTVTANGDAQISTAQSKFGGASAAFDGTGDYLSVPDDAAIQFGSGDFTIECWVYVLDRTNTFGSVFVSKGVVASLTAAQFWSFQLTSTGVLTFFAHDIYNPTVSGTSVIAENQWLHVAVCRSGNTHMLFEDGVLINTQTHSYTQSAGGNVYVGTQWFDPGASARSLNGYIDDLRITKGVARYTGSFTPPQRQFRP